MHFATEVVLVIVLQKFHRKYFDGISGGVRVIYSAYVGVRTAQKRLSESLGFAWHGCGLKANVDCCIKRIHIPRLLSNDSQALIVVEVLGRVIIQLLFLVSLCYTVPWTCRRLCKSLLAV